MIKSLYHNGLIEPSNGVDGKGFAIRKHAKLLIQLGKNEKVERLNIQLFRTSSEWTKSYIKIRINRSTVIRLTNEKIGHKEYSIDFPNGNSSNNIEITCRIFPRGISKFVKNLIFQRRKRSLVRDSILISRLYLDKNKVFDYNELNRFADFHSHEERKTHVRILGFFGQTFGLAEACRRTFKSLQKSSLSVSATQVPYSGKHHGKDVSIKADKKIPTNYDEIRIFHFNGDHFDHLINDWGEEVLNCKYKIGYWHWELPDFPEDYRSWFNLVDEVWVPSKFVFDAIAPKSPKPVQIIPLAIDEEALKPPSPDREKFSIPHEKIVFLITFDFYSIMERKNPIAGVNAFCKLIEDNEYKNKVHLVVKISNKHADLDGMKHLSKILSSIDSTKVTLVDRVLRRFEMLQLMNSCDALISLHKSEGFGLHLAEFMAMGKAILATNWSGNVDFMNESNSYPVHFKIEQIKRNAGPYRKGNFWAEVDNVNAVSQMKKLLNHEFSCCNAIKEEARKRIKLSLSLSKVSSIIAKRIGVIDSNF
jgi:glycosyltransferase involved in cell wall biosynthesis